MNRRFFRHVRTALRLLFPTPSEWRYARDIRRSGLFDRDFYLTSNPRMPLLCRIFPERHYVLRGEPLGICPSADFSPLAYLHLNPDLAARGVRPLAHYIANGLAENRAARDLPIGAAELPVPVIRASDGPAPPAAFAVVVHLFYPDLWPELAAVLARQQFGFDLFVTLTEGRGTEGGEDTAALAARILADVPQARVWVLPNHGRDIFPFVHLVNSGVLRPYLAVCKLHTKKSPHRSDGDLWRRGLIDGILGDPARTARRLAAFVADPQAGFWVADGHLCAGPDWWGSNEARTRALLARAGVPVLREALCFAAGSIYWVSAAMLDRLAGLQLAPGDFEREIGQVDGTTAHALERGLGVLAIEAGLALHQTRDLDALEQTQPDPDPAQPDPARPDPVPPPRHLA